MPTTKFSVEDFLANPWKYAAIRLVLVLAAAFAGEPDLGEWTWGHVLTQLGLPALAGLVGYILLKRQRDRSGSDK